MMKARTTFRVGLLVLSLVAVPALAWAGPGDAASPFASAVRTTFVPAAADDAAKQAIAGGFNMIHVLGDTSKGFFGTYTYRVTEGTHPIEIAAQVVWSRLFGENQFNVMGGVHARMYRNEMIAAYVSGMAGILRWDGETGFGAQVTGVIDVFIKQLKAFAIEAEFGWLIDRASDGDLFNGFVFNVGVKKSFGGK